MWYMNYISIKLFLKGLPEFPGGPVVKNGLPLQGVQVGFLVRELRSHMVQPNAKECSD